ncbi:MAG: hypothetical protein IK001_08395 [Lachnospiraceae bacterium]|nr:hypothetical protein [Lachnospiraceae bacterium]
MMNIMTRCRLPLSPSWIRACTEGASSRIRHS